MTETDLKPILREYLRQALKDDQDLFLSAPSYRPVYINPVDGLEHADADRDILETLVGDWREAIAERKFGMVRREVEELMQIHGVPEDQRNELALGVLNAHLKVFEVAKERAYGRAIEVGFDENVPVRTSEAPKVNGPLFSVAVKKYIRQKVDSGSWSANGATQNDAAFRMFLQVVGDKPVEEYTQQDMIPFRDALVAMPSNHATGPEWRELTVQQIISKADSMGDVERLGERTCKRLMTAISGFFKYLKDSERILSSNPAEGVSFKDIARKPSDRQAWPDDKLVELFSSPNWTGCKPTRRAQVGDKIVWDGKYWTPLLALFHGCRMQELCQLQRADIKCEDEIHYMHLTDEVAPPEGDGKAVSKRLKNKVSKRRVPVHPFVIEMGFLDYVERKAPLAADPLFPDLRERGKDKKRSIAMSRWFTEYRKKVDIYERLMDFHSFRHNVTTMLAINSNVSKIHRIAITGHEGEGTDELTYLKREAIPIKDLYDTVCEIKWPRVEEVLRAARKGSGWRN